VSDKDKKPGTLLGIPTGRTDSSESNNQSADLDKALVTAVTTPVNKTRRALTLATMGTMAGGILSACGGGSSDISSGAGGSGGSGGSAGIGGSSAPLIITFP